MPQPSIRRSTRVMNPHTRYENYVSYVDFLSNYGEPNCYWEEMKVYESVKWKEAMEDEMDSLERNKRSSMVEI
jgi:hypothetical protein